MLRMIVAATLSAAAAVSVASQPDASVIDAERAYAERARTEGQWTAFRETAADDAVLFVPEPVEARAWLKGRPDPPHAVRWQPAVAFTSCDGTLAVTTGPWQRSATVGYFTTVWRRGPSGWRWILDSGDALATARASAPRRPPVRQAACLRPPAAMAAFADEWPRSGGGKSADGTLRWSWSAEHGTRHVVVYIWTGEGFDRVIDDVVASEGG